MTIVRIPYLNTLQDRFDFLYATINVGILSTSEIGIGITTSAAATLRPLFRSYFMRSQLGPSSIDFSSRPWPSYPLRSGYVRNREGGLSIAEEDHINVTTVTRIQKHSTESQENCLPGMNE